MIELENAQYYLSYYSVIKIQKCKQILQIQIGLEILLSKENDTNPCGKMILCS